MRLTEKRSVSAQGSQFSPAAILKQTLQQAIEAPVQIICGAPNVEKGQ
ncbi:hypothetical protein BSAF29S_04364 [Bacillus safensis subsp. safensis]